MSDISNPSQSIEIYDQIIGLKKLSGADLGHESTHQTHIGLINSIFKFFEDDDEAESILLYDQMSKTLPASYHRIQPSGGGSGRSIGLRTGINQDASLLKTIREICRKKDCGWYLIWFSLIDKTPVFILFDSESDIYKCLVKNGINPDKRISKGISSDDNRYRTILSCINPILTEYLGGMDKELEIAVQTGNQKTRFTHKNYVKASKRMQEIGREGEEIINRYFQELRTQKKIDEYEWKNKDGESGEPYDFIVKKSDEIVYLDVKTTGYDFSRPMVFSKQEIDFVANSGSNYAIYRVYRGNNAKYCLRVCSNSKENFQKIDTILKECAERLKLLTTLETAKLTIDPNSNDLLFDEEINLDF
ncbi:DUF3883 domain-containing protein [Methanomassiliicoccales archaeon LGM-RCC1]|nr:DUF3883 domain-containing protein [Methanomassiliicoccales archaeon LGM-RCC1]